MKCWVLTFCNSADRYIDKCIRVSLQECSYMSVHLTVNTHVWNVQKHLKLCLCGDGASCLLDISWWRLKKGIWRRDGEGGGDQRRAAPSHPDRRFRNITVSIWQQPACVPTVSSTSFWSPTPDLETRARERIFDQRHMVYIKKKTFKTGT